MSSTEKRKVIALDTLARIDEIIASTPGASADSRFIPSQLPALDQSKNPNHPRSPVKIVNSDSFSAARAVVKTDPRANGRTAVLNLASDEFRAGGWRQTLACTQEEALCYSSTLYATLHESYYPWPNLGPGSTSGVYSPGVVVFKHDLDHDCVDLPDSDRIVVGVITVSAPCVPELTEDLERFAISSDLEDLRGKIRLVYRMAASNGNEYIIMGAMGCGAYCNPPRVVAAEMKAILMEDEFTGWFKSVVFAIYSRPSNGPGNFEVFQETFGRE